MKLIFAFSLVAFAAITQQATAALIRPTRAVLHATNQAKTIPVANRRGSHRVGGTNSHGKGSHYVGG